MSLAAFGRLVYRHRRFVLVIWAGLALQILEIPGGGAPQKFLSLATGTSFSKYLPTSALILWQIGALGDSSASSEVEQPSPLELLVKRLLEIYPQDHRVCIYEAVMLPGFEPMVRWLALAGLPGRRLSTNSTLYLPAIDPPRFDPLLYSAHVRGG